jgi:hypothetical protein
VVQVIAGPVAAVVKDKKDKVDIKKTAIGRLSTAVLLSATASLQNINSGCWRVKGINGILKP